MMSEPSVRRLPAEWEMDGAVMVAWPHEATDWVYMLDEVRQCVGGMIRAMLPWTRVIVVCPDVEAAAESLKSLKCGNLIFFKAPTNDTWTRDYGPLTVVDDSGNYSVCDFRFNGWGLKFASCHDNMVVKRMCDSKLICAPRLNCQDFVLEGGGIESDGSGLLMTTAMCQLSPNRNAKLDCQQIDARLRSYFGAENVIWLHHGYLAGDDTDSHIDTLARFAPGDTILYVGCDDVNDEHFEALQSMERELKAARTLGGRPFNLIRLPLPDPVYDENGLRLPATYANFLALSNAVFLPTYGQPRKDTMARQMLEMAFDVPVIEVDCRQLIRQHGSFHCMTMQLPSQILSI